MKKMNRPKYMSLTGISSILTAHVLPVSAQVAPTPMQVHFAPQIVHSVIDQSQVHIHHQTTVDQSQVHVHQQVIPHQGQSVNLNPVHTSGSSSSQDLNSSSNISTTVHHHSDLNPQNTQTFANSAQTTTHSGQSTTNQSSPLVPHHQSTNPPSSGFSLLHHLHHNNAPSNQSYTNVGHTQGQIQQQNQSPMSTATVAPHEHHLQWLNNGPISGNNTVNLDLSSSAQVATLGHQLNNVSVMINVGGAQMQVTSSTQLTAAEKVAALQVMSTGQQGLILDAKGTADGGSMSITPWLANHLGNLVIPSGVSVSDVSKVGSLTVHGSLTDSGDLYVSSTNPNVSTASLTASNISINSGGVLSNVLPSASTASAINPVNFNISSLNNITNAGSIESSGALLLSTGGSFVNTAQGADAASAGVVHATNDITINSGSGAITNGGLVSSTSGNITLATASPATNLNINAAGGTFQAERAAINIQPATYTGSAQTNLNGGNYLSQQLNLNGGAGTVTANIDQVSGVVNTTAGDAHVEAASTGLQLGTMNISGDPTYYNSQGSIVLGNAFTVTGDLAIVARGNITSNFDVTTNASPGQAGNITLIAGSTFSAAPPNGGPDSTTTITLSNASPPDIGGSVQINGNVTSSGNITIVANNGILSTGNIDIAGTTKTSGGDVTMIAGATSGAGITTGAIQTYGAGAAGNVTLLTATPVISGNGTLSILNGTMNGGYVKTGLPENNASITTGNISATGSGGAASFNGTNGGSISIQAGSNISSGSILTFGGGGGGASAGFTFGGSGGSGGSVAITSSTGAIAVNGAIDTSGGGGGGSEQTPTEGGNAGNVNLYGSSTVSINGPILAASGGSGGVSVIGTGGGGGGGSFGGGGGASYSFPNTAPLRTSAGGGGGFGGGGGSGDGNTNGQAAGSGGGITGGIGGLQNGSPGTAGSGGNGSTTIGQYGAGGGFGQPGQAVNLIQVPASAAGEDSTGFQPTAGTVTITAGREFSITQVVGSLNASAAAGPYANESIDARGTNGSINVTVLTPVSNVYLADAKYDSGASTYLAPTSGVYSKGDWAANTIQVTTPASTFTGASTATSAQVSTGGSTETLLEGTSHVVVKPGDLVTPAEYIAFLQAASGGQTLQLGQTAAGTTPGTGYADGGNFAVAATNIPSSNFTNLVLPANVVENVSAPSLTYTGSGAVSGTINTTGTQLNFGTDLSLSGTGAINFNAPSGGTLNAYSSITGAGNTLVSVTNPAGTLNLTTSNTSPGTGNIQLNVVAPSVTVGTNAIDNTSGSATITNTTPGASTIGTTSAVNNLTYTATGAGTSIGINAVDAKNNVMVTDVLGTAGGIAINGIVNAGSTIALYTAGSGDITQGNTGASLNADSVQLITTGGNIGNGAQNGTILVSASNVYLGSDPGKYLSGSGNAFIQDAISGSVYASPAFGHDSSSLGSLNVIDLGSSVSVNGYIMGDTTVQGVEGNNTSISASLQSFDTITLKATGTGTIGGFGQDYITNLTTDTGDASFTLIQTPGGINLNVGGNANINSNDFSFLNGSVGGTLQFTSGQYDPTYIGTVLVGSGLSTISGASINVGTLTAAPGGSVQLTTIPGFSAGGISGGGTITADSVQLTTSSQFDIGTSGSPINLVTQEFSASGNNIYLSNTGNATVDSLTFSGTQAALSNVGTLNIMGLTGTNTNSQNIRADIRASGAITVSGPIAISASSNSNSSLQFASTTTGDPITVINNAAITASNGSGNGGVIAFNGGMTGTVSLSGTGTVNADTYVAFGNIDPVTLVPIDGQVVPNTASFVNGLVSFSQSAPIGNQIFVAPLVPPPPTPPQPPAIVVVPTGSGGANGGLGDSFFGVGGFGIPITTTASNTGNQSDAASLGSQLANAQHLVQQLFNLSHANPDLAPGNPFNKLNEQIGTRIATDYTPNVFPVTRRFTDLEGGIELSEKLSEIPGQAIFGVSEFNANELSTLASHGVQYGQNSKDQYLNLMKGFVLFAPDKDITVEVREGTVHIPKGCIAWVMETGADSAIYDLHDSLSTGAVRVVVNNKEIKMGPGTQLLLTRDMNSSFNQLNPGSSVGYRNVRSTDMGNGIRTFVADFSIAHGLENLEVLHSLFYSQDPKHRKLVAQMLKNAAILASLTGGNESYKTGASTR